MVKIARGTTGQVRIERGGAGVTWMYDGFAYRISHALYSDSTGALSTGNGDGTGGSGGWSVTYPPVSGFDSPDYLDFNVTVPLVASGIYFIATDRMEQYGEEPPMPVGIVAAFEVVCLTAQISVTEIYRDEEVYRLSCTATPQGGTAPYSYSWVSDIIGSNAISGQYEQTLIIEIPVGGIGTVSGNITDSSTPTPCTATASFAVCDLTCDFTTTLVGTPSTGDIGPYEYECQASTTGGQGPYTYAWQTEFGAASRQTVQLSFPDNTQRKIHLLITDAENCRAFKTKQVGDPSSGTFTVSTNPAGTSPGTPSGLQDNMQFNITVTATATSLDNPPARIFFESTRPATAEVSIVPGYLILGSNPPRYEVSAMK